MRKRMEKQMRMIYIISSRSFFSQKNRAAVSLKQANERRQVLNFNKTFAA